MALFLCFPILLHCLFEIDEIGCAQSESYDKTESAHIHSDRRRRKKEKKNREKEKKKQEHAHGAGVRKCSFILHKN